MRNTQEHTEPIQEERSQKSKHLGLLRGTGVHSLQWVTARHAHTSHFLKPPTRVGRRSRVPGYVPGSTRYTLHGY